VYVTGVVQGTETPSRAQLNVESGSLDEKVKVALVSVVTSSGPESMVVSGAVMSAAVTVQV
jgi:hypothetical protein